MESVEAEGETIDAAIDGALKRLGVPRERAEIEILSNASRGLFGIGGRKARVRATVRPPIALVASVPSAPRAPAGRPVSSEPRAAAAVEAHHAVAERASGILRDIVQHIGVDGQVIARDEGEHLLLELTGDSSGVLIGRRGQMLDALEYIVNRIVSRDDGASTRIIVDSQGYRARRQTSLEELAQRMGEQAKQRQRAVTLNPMSPRDRRIVHLVLQGDASLTTKSSGKGYFRRLIIIPEGAKRPARSER